MPSAEVETVEGLFPNPRPALITLLSVGVGASFLAYVLSWFGSKTLPIGPLLIGILLTGIAVNLSPRSWWVLASASLVALLGIMTTDQCQWEPSLKRLFWVAAGFAFFCALLVLMAEIMYWFTEGMEIERESVARFNRIWQRSVVSVLLVFHFTGIVTAVTSAPPAPWLANWMWAYIFRPYLQFMYLNNAYHFYSPEPGPATLLWFHIEYQPDEVNGEKIAYSRWVKIPDMDDDGRTIDFDALGHKWKVPAVQHTRRLSLAEMINQPGNPLDPSYFMDLQKNRLDAGNVYGIPPVDMRQLPLNLQYREPAFLSKRWLSSYARHVASKFKHADRPEKAVIAVKVYRVNHNYVSYNELASSEDDYGRRVPGRSIHDPTLYFPVYMGEFDPDGNMTAKCRERYVAADGLLYDKYRDPLLYWAIPIAPKEGEKNTYINYVKKHAGDTDYEFTVTQKR